MDALVTITVLLLFVELCYGFSHVAWAFRRTRQFVAEHPNVYRAVAGCSFVTGLVTGFALSQQRTEPLEAIGIGCLAALFSIPVWFIAMSIVAFFHHSILAPTLEIVGIFLSPFFWLFRTIFGVARRHADHARDALGAPSREREEIRERDALKRRENARARCEMLYTLHAPELASRFTKAMLDDYLRRYMGDNREPDYVEERAEQLGIVLQQHLEKVQPPPKFKTLEDIARWFEAQKRQLDSLPDDRTRQTLLVKLKTRYTELTTQFLEEMQA